MSDDDDCGDENSGGGVLNPRNDLASLSLFRYLRCPERRRSG